MSNVPATQLSQRDLAGGSMVSWTLMMCKLAPQEGEAAAWWNRAAWRWTRSLTWPSCIADLITVNAHACRKGGHRKDVKRAGYFDREYPAVSSLEASRGQTVRRPLLRDSAIESLCGFRSYPLEKKVVSFYNNGNRE